MKRRFYILACLCILLSLPAWGAPSFTVQPPRQVEAGGKFTVTFRLANAGEGTGLKAPQISGCTLIFGPSVSTMQSFQVINGQASSSRSVDYTFTYRADKPGTYTIPSASINVDGKTLRSSEARFTVVPSSGRNASTSPLSPSRPATRPYELDDPSTHSAERGVKSGDVFVRIILSKSEAYEQEAIECTIKLYTKYQISSFMATQQPTFDGFLAEELNFQPQMNAEETYNGQRYATAVLKKVILFPQKSGKLTINSGRYDLNVVQFNTVQMGIFQRMDPVERKIQVNSNAASVNVRPLPSPQPEGFTGAVGSFTIDSDLKGSNFRTGEAASLIYTIKGTGNIKYVKTPVIDFPTEFEQYTPQTDIKAEISGSNVTGTMTIDYTFVPETVGDFTIGADKFVYFDPAKREYITLSTPSYNLKVAKGAARAVRDERKDISAKNLDILHIKMGDNSQSHTNTLVALQWWYWLIYVTLGAALVFGVFAASKRIKLNADTTARKLSKANKVARQRLNEADRLMRAHQSEKFYEELLRAVWGYLSDKLSIPTSQLTRENIAAELKGYGASDDLSQKFINILDECEMARYTPSGSDEQLERLYRQSSDAISEMASLKVKPQKSAK